ncbi:GNAT family N-acetyltransferase [Conexibacter stalactiti]|uniref:GNAT family N-acetyltransferase n=1 Tax=Conexibacter stalactiti TaxID=1940611 RepID=A0ABU4HVU3_9ACTN|nr:GNAT family N-acetyltransferase [Conexibacter stalactiti]MDW5597451.1 GNAT family N-acetyltransferase [Conexibacter stalactiti]MEC5038093.1 GNAT family N-acetyltransferase [Conexibacter stalactiti]
MSSASPPPASLVRRAGAADAEAIGRLLHDFNAEYEMATASPAAIAERIRSLLAEEPRFTVLLAGGRGGAGSADDEPDADGAGAREPVGFAVLRFRAALASAGLECYLAELYVVPAARGRGLGRALMETAIALARAEGADWIDLGTSEDDHAARALYESLGFVNREGGPDGPVSYVYELEL